MADIRWLTSIGDYQVQKHEIPRSGGKPYYLNGSTLIGVLHTTEGSSVQAALTALSDAADAPHFVVGEGKIVQCRPLNVQGAALRPGNDNSANVHAQIQIEMVAMSQQKLWLPGAPTLQPAVAVLAFCNKALSIPLTVPNDWPDDCHDVALPWAAYNSRRRQAAAGLWPKEKGWWMHMEVPYQSPSWHWDCGAIQRTQMLSQARELAATIQYKVSS